jgi:uncharacterized membrane protein SpoIIM required for sporulation
MGIHWHRVGTLVRRELRDQLRDWRVVIPLVILTGVFPLLMNFTARTALDFVSRYGAPLIAEQLFPFLLMIVGFFPTSVSLVIALESFVGEKERFTLEPLLSTPLSDQELFIGKAMASTVTPVASAGLGIMVYLVGLHQTTGWSPSAGLLLQILVLTVAHAVGMVSAAVVISAQTNSVRAANLLASFIIIPAALLVQGESLIMFWRRYDVLWWVILGILLLATVLVRIGLRRFRRDELLEHEVEELRFDRLWSQLVQRLTAGARSPRAWYRDAVFPALRRVWEAGPWVLLAMLLGAGLGIAFAQRFPLSLPGLAEARSGQEVMQALQEQGFFSPAGVLLIFVHNLQAILLASILGIFSLGVLALIALMAPIGLVTYAAALVGLAGGSPWLFLAAFVLPHGILEIPAAWLAGASMLRLGACMLAEPDRRTLGEIWIEAFADWVKVNVGVVAPLLLAAAVVETYVTPAIVAWGLARGMF